MIYFIHKKLSRKIYFIPHRYHFGKKKQKTKTKKPNTDHKKSSQSKYTDIISEKLKIKNKNKITKH